MATSSQTYVYSPLPSRYCIRLLRRTGVGQDGLLEFTLKTVDLGMDVTYQYQMPLYHCLSYTWGNPHANVRGFREKYDALASDYAASELTPIRCDGKVLSVGRNLHEALSGIPTTDGWTRRIIDRQHPDTKRTLLHDKAASGSAAIMHLWVGQGANVHAKDQSGRTPLHEAAIYGHVETAKILIKGGSDVAAVDVDGKTPEAHALEHAHMDLASLLKTCADDGIETACSDIEEFNPFGPDDFVWVDAICIDQNNLEERAAQVSIMDIIFENARYVLVWLGRADEHTAAAIETISKLMGSANSFANSDLVPYRTNTREEYESAGVPYISQEDWNSLASLFLRQWFRRIWSVQESAFARGIQVYCGAQEIRWPDLAQVLDLISYRYGHLGYESSVSYVPIDEIVPSVEYYARIVKSKVEAKRGITDKSHYSYDLVRLSEQFSLENLLISILPFKATDPRDKIFTLLPLSSLHRRNRYGLVPNYTQTVERCYANATKSIIMEKRHLTCLSYVQDQSFKEIKSVPSWVPDYSLSSTNPLPRQHFLASGDFQVNIQPENAVWNELYLTGWEFDIIERVSDARHWRGNGKTKYEFDESWLDLILTMDTTNAYSRTGQPISEVLWRTLCVNHGFDGEYPAPLAYGAMFKRFLCAMICAEPEMQARESEQKRENAIVLGGLMKTALSMQNEPTSDSSDPAEASRGPDEEYMASLRKQMTPVDRSLDSSFFDCVRPVLSKLERVTAGSKDDCIPTPQEVEEYFQESAFPIRNPDGTVNLNPQIRPYILAHGAVYGIRRLFATSKGYLGLGPSSLEVGDCLWIAPNAKLPLILRPLPRQESSETHIEREAPAEALHSSISSEETKKVDSQHLRFNFIGEAYVHGIMQGEALEKKTEQTRKEIILV